MVPQTRVTVSGDAESGWIVDVHDGEKQGTYTPTGKTVSAVIRAAMREHEGETEPEHVEKPDDAKAKADEKAKADADAKAKAESDEKAKAQTTAATRAGTQQAPLHQPSTKR